MVKIFCHSLGCCLVWMTLSFAEQTLFSIIKFHLLIFGFSTFIINVLVRRFLPMWINSSPFAIITSVRFRDSGLCWSPWSIWSCVVFRVINVDLFELFHMPASSLMRTACGRLCLCFQWIFLSSSRKFRCSKECGILSGSLIWFGFLPMSGAVSLYYSSNFI